MAQWAFLSLVRFSKHFPSSQSDERTGCFPFLTNYPELNLHYWAQKFGSLYSLWLGNQLFVIVSDPQIVKDLMVTNGAVFSSRKEYFLKSQTIFAGRGITANPYNDRWYVSYNFCKFFLIRKKGENIVASQNYG